MVLGDRQPVQILVCLVSRSFVSEGFGQPGERLRVLQLRSPAHPEVADHVRQHCDAIDRRPRLWDVAERDEFGRKLPVDESLYELAVHSVGEPLE